ncbi:hypothetical protein OY671_009962, partial [Metschnikowia pulcherrima]
VRQVPARTRRHDGPGGAVRAPGHPGADRPHGPRRPRRGRRRPHPPRAAGTAQARQLSGDAVADGKAVAQRPASGRRGAAGAGADRRQPRPESGGARTADHRARQRTGRAHGAGRRRAGQVCGLPQGDVRGRRPRRCQHRRRRRCRRGRCGQGPRLRARCRGRSGNPAQPGPRAAAWHQRHPGVGNRQ